jgi:hypothetical protein
MQRFLDASKVLFTNACPKIIPKAINVTTKIVEELGAKPQQGVELWTKLIKKSLMLMDQVHMWKVTSKVLVLFVFIFPGQKNVTFCKVGFFTHFRLNRQKLQLSTPNFFE